MDSGLRRLRVYRVPEDADDGQEIIVRERIPRPDWFCEADHCGHYKNDGRRDTCAICGCPREDGW